MSDPLRLILASVRARREIPPKYFYFGEGARNWDRYSRDERYRLGQGEEKHLVRSLPAILDAVGPGELVLADLGPGNGVKAGLIFAHGSARGRIRALAALDISGEILALVRKNSRKLFPGARASFVRVDFETQSIRPILGDLKARAGRRALILLLGSGNVTNKPAVLRHVRGAMSGSDFFLMSAELRRAGEIGRILGHYRTKESQNVVFFGLRCLGVRESDGHFVVGFNRRREQAEVSFALDREVSAGPEGRLRLNKGTRILLFTSHKPTVRSLRRTLETMGFEIVLLLTDGTGRLALALCRKGRRR